VGNRAVCYFWSLVVDKTSFKSKSSRPIFSVDYFTGTLLTNTNCCPSMYESEAQRGDGEFSLSPKFESNCHSNCPRDIS
jgi:hypothetical protein